MDGTEMEYIKATCSTAARHSSVAVGADLHARATGEGTFPRRSIQETWGSAPKDCPVNCLRVVIAPFLFFRASSFDSTRSPPPPIQFLCGDLNQLAAAAARGTEGPRDGGCSDPTKPFNILIALLTQWKEISWRNARAITQNHSSARHAVRLAVAAARTPSLTATAADGGQLHSACLYKGQDWAGIKVGKIYIFCRPTTRIGIYATINKSYPHPPPT